MRVFIYHINRGCVFEYTSGGIRDDEYGSWWGRFLNTETQCFPILGKGFLISTKRFMNIHFSQNSTQALLHFPLDCQTGSAEIAESIAVATSIQHLHCREKGAWWNSKRFNKTSKRFETFLMAGKQFSVLNSNFSVKKEFMSSWKGFEEIKERL